MGRSKPMRVAYYRGYNNLEYLKEVNCKDVTMEMKNKGTFHCMDCMRQVVHAGGKNPYYRLPSKDAEHEMSCDNYLPIDDLSERIRTVGEKLKIKLKIPFFCGNEEERHEGVRMKGEKSHSIGGKSVKVGPVTTIKAPNKSTTVTLNSAAELLYHTSFDRSDEHRKNVTRVLCFNKQFYYPSIYDELQRDFETGKLNPIIFVKGRLNQSQFYTFENHGYINVQDKPYDYGPIELRIHFNRVQELETRLKKITWHIKSGKNRTEEIGVMGQVIKVEVTEDKIFIHIRCYDLDVEPKDI